MTIEIMSQNEFLQLKQILNEILEKLQTTLKSNQGGFLTAKEVKEILKCSDGTLSNYRNSGVLTAQKLGGKYYYSQDNLNRLFNLEKGGNNGE
jgi:hypothetical protein